MLKEVTAALSSVLLHVSSTAFMKPHHPYSPNSSAFDPSRVVTYVNICSLICGIMVIAIVQAKGNDSLDPMQQ